MKTSFTFQDIKKTFSPQGLNADGQGTRALGRHVCLEELIEVAVVQVLHDDAERLLVAAHAQHPSDVHVLQSRQDPNIAVEIQPEQAQSQVMMCQIVTQSLNTSLTL